MKLSDEEIETLVGRLESGDLIDKARIQPLLEALEWMDDDDMHTRECYTGMNDDCACFVRIAKQALAEYRGKK
jgi:hypothetical protein